MRRIIVRNVIKIMIGAAIFATAVNAFSIANDLSEGGVTGITMILYYLFGITPALTNLFLNTILLIVGWKFLDKATIYYTFVAVAFTSLFLHLTSSWAFVTDQTIIVSIAAGTMMGVGMGLILLGNGTTAGSIILAKIMNKYLGWNISYAMLFFDIIVVVPSVLVVGFQNMLFTIVSLYISARVMDVVLEGFNPKKSVTIISTQHDQLADEISEKINRGITVFHGHGYYKKTDSPILYVVINRQQLLPLTKIINEIDPDAFTIVNDIQSVTGHGFTSQLTSED